jgi:hypothetical protein
MPYLLGHHATMLRELSITTLQRLARPAAADHLDAGRVDRFTAILDSLPPIVVFETESGLLLADGYHRLAAAKRLGATTILADVRSGSSRDALDFAVALAAAERGITRDEARDAIGRRSGEPDEERHDGPV